MDLTHLASHQQMDLTVISPTDGSHSHHPMTRPKGSILMSLNGNHAMNGKSIYPPDLNSNHQMDGGSHSRVTQGNTFILTTGPVSFILVRHHMDLNLITLLDGSSILIRIPHQIDRSRHHHRTGLSIHSCSSLDGSRSLSHHPIALIQTLPALLLLMSNLLVHRHRMDVILTHQPTMDPHSNCPTIDLIYHSSSSDES